MSPVRIDLEPSVSGRAPRPRKCAAACSLDRRPRGDPDTPAGPVHRGRRGNPRRDTVSAERSATSAPAFVDAVARRVVDLLREEGELPATGPRLMTVAQAGKEFGVSADWLYANAEALATSATSTSRTGTSRWRTRRPRPACARSTRDR